MTSNQKNQDGTRTINRQQEQEQEKNQQEKEKNYYYNNYYYHTEPGVSVELPPAEVLEKIAKAYRENIAARITGMAAGIIERALKNGMEPATVILAIEETGMASRPSPYYLAAVLRNWAETGVVLSRSRGGADVTTTEARPWWR